MLDLKIFILTHPKSQWDVKRLVTDCQAVFAGQEIRASIEVFLNPVQAPPALSPAGYILSSISAQIAIGFDRLNRYFSLITLWWLIRQIGALVLSFASLAVKKHRGKVRAEAIRASLIASGHTLMWQKAMQDSSSIYLFLEDDVTLTNPKMLMEVVRALLKLEADNQSFICDCSHSFSLSSLGIDPRSAEAGKLTSWPVTLFEFTFTNTLAATFVSREVLERIGSQDFRLDALKAIGIDQDLSRALIQSGPQTRGCISLEPIFEQHSAFRAKRI